MIYQREGTIRRRVQFTTTDRKSLSFIIWMEEELKSVSLGLKLSYILESQGK